MEKTENVNHEEVDRDLKEVAEVKTISGSDAFNEALLKEPPKPFSSIAITLYMCALVGFFCSTMNGYDGSLFNSLLMADDFKNTFAVDNKGIEAGIVSAMYQIGGVVAIPFIGPAVDTWGRRWGMFIGATAVILGTIIQGTTVNTHSVGQFMGGRFLLGFGVGIAASAGPIYVVEISHPAYRGVVTALYNTFWFTGSIICTGTVRGAFNYTGHITWLLPVWLQLMCSGIIVSLCLFLPESPRWLYINNKQDQAKAMITKFHGEGNEDSVWVQLQLREYHEFLEMDGADKRWWDYRALFRSRGSVYRLICNCMISIWGQWAGNAVISYYLSAVLDTAGITDSIKQADIALGLSCLSFVIAIIGATCVDRLGRRPLLLFTNTGCCLIWMGITIASAQYAKDNNNKGAANAVLGLIYVFGFVYSFGFTPLQALYPVEVLSFEMRAKGMGFSNMAVNAAGLLNQFAWPVALQKIAWRTYIIFTIWCGIQAVTIYFFIPETKKRTLEELDDIFAAPNPVKASLQKKKIALDASHNVVNVEDA